MRIIELQAENVKRLRAVSVRPEGNVVVVGGDNGAGKTSLLDSIAMALGGARLSADVPVRMGEREATVNVLLGNDSEVELQVHLRIVGNKRELVVAGADGERKPSPQAILDRLYSRATFDPLAFCNEKDTKKQAATLRSIVGVDFEDLDKKRSRLYDERTAVGRELSNASERMTSIPMSVLSAPDVEVDIKQLLAERAKIETHNRMASERASEVRRLEADAARLEEMLHAVRINIVTAKGKLVPFEDSNLVDETIAGAEESNRRVRARRERIELSRKCGELEAKTNDISDKIKAIDEEKARRLAEAPWPVPGLGFSEDGVILDGLPFSQASQAQKIRVSMAIGAALNPQLRVLLIRDASLLDRKSMEIVRQLAEEKDMQVWLERVGGSDPGAIIIEDGEVVSADDRV